MRYLAAGLLLVLFAFSTATAAEGPTQKLIQDKAKELAAATQKGDHGKFVDLTHPKIVEMLGGRDKMIALLKSFEKEMKAKGSAFQSVTVGTASKALPGGTDLFATVPMTLVITVPGGALRKPSYLLAVSADKGKTWTFVDGNGINDKNLAKLFPKFPKALTLPKKEKAVFEKAG